MSISAQTGFTELVMDPANPDVLYTASLQRERREYGFLPGGTESAIWKTTDGAKSWTKLTNDDTALRLRYWDCRENGNNAITKKGDGTSEFETFDFEKSPKR